MAPSASPPLTMPIRAEDDIVLVRRKVRALAKEIGLDAFAATALTTATSEIARNVWVHAGGGDVVIEALREGTRRGLRLTFTDQGPGIPDIPRVLVGGYSTARSLGLGVSGAQRLVDRFSIVSRDGHGTCVTMEKWTRF